MADADRYNLGRFVSAQEPVYAQVVAELSAGQKQSHWMWFIFPQIAGLGTSGMARRFAISGRAEAEAYLAHPVLGARLRECVGLVNRVAGRGLNEILGYPDDLKFRSSATLFAAVAPGERVFQDALQRWFGGVGDEATLRRL